MIGDAVFNAFAAVESVWSEIDRLIAAAPNAFSPHLNIAFDVDEGTEDLSASRYGYHFKLTGAVARQRLPGQLLLAFDLARPEIASTWPYAKSSLLTCAYSTKYSEGWYLEDVILGMDGRQTDPEMATVCSRHAGGRLLLAGRNSDEWNRSDWLFTVPLLAIDGHESFHAQIVTPVLSLLIGNATPDAALNGTAAIVYAEST